MIGSDAPDHSRSPGHSRSLSRQVNVMEKQIMLRRHRLRVVVTGIKHKITAGMVSPAMLLTAAGIGVVVEQTSRRRGWSLATVLDAANASIRLLFSVSSPMQPVSGNTTSKSTDEFTRR